MGACGDFPAPLVMRLCRGSSVLSTVVVADACCQILPHDELEQGVAAEGEYFKQKGLQSPVTHQMLAAANMASAKCCTRLARFQETQANIARRGAVNVNDM